MNARQLRVTMNDIAAVAGLPTDTVRRHRRERMFDFEDFGSVVKYAGSYMLLASLKRESGQCSDESDT